jgi:hypothetical protein
MVAKYEPKHAQIDINNGFNCDNLLTWCQNGHIREWIEKTMINLLPGLVEGNMTCNPWILTPSHYLGR